MGKLLIADDNPFIAAFLQDDLRLAQGTNGIDAAVELSSRANVGILYVTANPHQVTNPPAPVGAAWLSKPFTEPELMEALRVVEQITTTGQAPEPVSPKLRLIPRGVNL